MIAAIYARVSKEEQHTENQIPELREYAQRQGWEVAEYLEEASGKEGGKRPVLAQLLKDAQAKKIDVVLAWKIDRFGRSVRDFVDNIKTLDNAGVRFVATSQGLDTDKRNPMTKMMMYLLAIIAEFERDLIVERVGIGLQRYRKAYAAGRIGKEEDQRQSKSKRNLPCGRPKKVFDRYRALEMRQQGMSWRNIAKELERFHGYKVPPPTIRLALKQLL
jgi:putative DNA-invertase from lambdoid prophage Rac